MNIAQINVFEKTGGAARAAHRLHQGLRELGHNSKMVVLSKQSTDPNVLCVRPPQKRGLRARRKHHLYDLLQNGYVSSRRTAVSNTLFSTFFPGFNLGLLSPLKEADVINLHWVPGLALARSVKSLVDTGTPVVWTLHDQWSFTGGCHYSSGCIAYEDECRSCPQLSRDELQLAFRLFKEKQEILPSEKITVVAPSTWLSDKAKRSRVFHNSRIETIPNGLETNLLFPVSKTAAKKALGIAPLSTTILFGADYTGEKRKGFQVLLEAIELLSQDPAIESFVNTKKINILIFGHTPGELRKQPIEVFCKGHVKDDDQLRMIYSAADLGVIPSFEDNYPNLMIEALSCGTPVVGTSASGMVDLLERRNLGIIIPPNDPVALKRAVVKLVLEKDLREKMGRAAAKEMKESHSLAAQAARYLELYSELTRDSHKCKTPSGTEGKQYLFCPILDESPRELWPSIWLRIKYEAKISRRLIKELHKELLERATRLKLFKAFRKLFFVFRRRTNECSL